MGVEMVRGSAKEIAGGYDGYDKIRLDVEIR